MQGSYQDAQSTEHNILITVKTIKFLFDFFYTDWKSYVVLKRRK